MKRIINELKFNANKLKEKSLIILDSIVEVYVEKRKNEFNISDVHLWDVESSTISFLKEITERYYEEAKDMFEDRDGLNSKIEELISLCNQYKKYEEMFEDIPEDLHIEILTKFGEISKRLWW